MNYCTSSRHLRNAQSILRGSTLRTQPWSSQNQNLPSLSRRVRTKAGTGFYNDPVRRDERLLKRLEAQLENVQAKISREEKDRAAAMKKQGSHGARSTSDDHNLHFWRTVLTETDRRELASIGVNSMDQLYTVHSEAEAALYRSPNLTVEGLPHRLKYAHQMYTSIPAKLNAAGHEKANAKSRWGGWF